MKYLYCIIAIGEKYFVSAKNLANKLNTFSNNHHVLIISDKTDISIKNATILKIPDDKVIMSGGFFNYNLKYYPILIASQMDCEYIIHIDADWRIRDEYDPSGVDEMLNYMNKNSYDILFERPHNIGTGKIDKGCFWNHKKSFYNLLDTTEYDSGHVCNEQYIVFKNNDKLKVFINKWEELYYKSSEANLWGFAEGVEIGMSMAFAKMAGSYKTWESFVRNMYEFNNVSGELFVRF